MKNKIYHAVGKVPTIDRQIVKTEIKSTPLTQTYKTAHLSGLVQTLKKWRGSTSFTTLIYIFYEKKV